ncbi:zinc finger MYM-type protein 1-like [Amphibalanus amphitrite]|uniref:zinc finger MYM-type protein 1-like n=1 Tax=Amphibalanus amphitrite TaxID=1232801 RepID=UPI001C91047B|nr:zinc finger MYM-type protein 1-like [Amphibalanus amphitrite]
MIRNALDITNELTSFVRNSPKTAALLRRLALGTESGTGSLRPLCPTRWTCRTASLRSVLENYEFIMHTLEEVSTESSGEHARRAGGMLALMGQFDTLMGLRMAIEVFSIAEDLSRGLQSATATVGDTQKAVTRVCERFDSMRTTVSFDKTYKKTERDAEEVGVDGPQLPRKRKVPMKLGGGDQHPDATAKEMYRRQFFEVLDLLTNQLKERFTQPTFEKAREVERVLEDASAGRDVSVPAVVRELYGDDLDLARLEVQLKMLPDVVGGGRNSVHEVLQALVDSKQTGGAVFQRMMSEVLTLAKLYLTVPVTTATAERCFSSLRRIKSYIRSTMGQGRLNAAMLCATHRQRVDELNVDLIATEFFGANDRRRSFFGR